MNEHLEYNVYILFMDSYPVYVGCTTDIKKRIQQHKYRKEIIFNGYCIYAKDFRKQYAYLLERQVTIILNYFGNCNLHNINGTTKNDHLNKPEIIKI